MKNFQILLVLLLSISYSAMAVDYKTQSDDTQLKLKASDSLLPSLRLSAEKGNSEAQYSLGNIYKQGLGVEVSDVRAFFWYKKAAEQGRAKAQNNLAFMYQSGLGT
ncbi:MAG: sel1 repeat family protein, partial [Gilliamella sp.]|nr:sel1 repeat family protein [Gilliamella sp.]